MPDLKKKVMSDVCQIYLSSCYFSLLKTVFDNVTEGVDTNVDCVAKSPIISHGRDQDVCYK